MYEGIWCACWFFVLSHVIAQEPVATLPQGRIVGIKVYSESSLNPVEIFFGIPYATPPIGRFRFSAPERHSGWRRTFFAHRMPPRCPQLNDGDNDYTSEDCLFLNIWTPRRADGKTLPVAVILYADSWERNGATLPCQELAAEGIVVVTVAFRLHLLSFFTLRSVAARGNLALLDQYLALLWIRDNIAAFGGDPTTITLIGHSIGGDSVLHHIASPRSIGLFQRVLIMSPHDIWKSIDKDMDFMNATEAERISRQAARSLGCASKLDQEILQCMRSRPLTDILTLYSKSNLSMNMQPVPDDFLPETEQYLPMPLSAALSAGKQTMQLDLLLGTTDLEAINNIDLDYEELLKRGATYVYDYANNKVAPEVFKMLSLPQHPESLQLLMQAVRWEYFGVKTRNNAEKEALVSVEALARMQSSARWGAGSALLAARLARRVARLYVYRYTQPGGLDLRAKQHNFTGAVHGTDLIALLGDAFMLQVARRRSTTDEKHISTIFRKYIANFIQSGSPTIEEEWQRYRTGDAYVHEIRSMDALNSQVHSSSKESAFWLQYLPRLLSFEQTQQLTSDTGDTRMRGGVFAMCGISLILLLLLFVCAIMLHKQRARRSSTIEDSHL